MCGICGVIDIKGNHSILEKTIVDMSKTLSYRGPDGYEKYIKNNVAFGFSRLSIIDLESGMQPLTNEDETIVLVCNGEIFNYKELTEQLIKKGHKFAFVAPASSELLKHNFNFF